MGTVGVEQWRDDGHLDIVHHAFGEHRQVGYELYADAAQYDSFSIQDGPSTIIFQGRLDDAVDPVMVERFARSRSYVECCLLDDGHQLHDSLDTIWDRITTFLDLKGSG